MIWWEKIVKPGVKHLLIKRGKEINKEKRGILNLLLVKQAYYVRKVQSGDFERLRDLKTTQNKINMWYEEESKRIVIQSQLKEINENEKVRIFHHKIHQRKMKRSSILKLEISDRETIVGHKKCADYLEKSVESMLAGPPNVNYQAQDVLLEEVEKVFTPDDNEFLLKLPTKEELHKYLCNSNMHAAPGSDGLTSYLYKQH